MTRINQIISIAVVLSLLFLISGCGLQGKLVSSASIMYDETNKLLRITSTEIEELISSDIDIKRIQNDPEGILGQYVRLRGRVDLKGTADFPLDGFNDGPISENDIFFLENTAYVSCIRNYPELKHNDMVEIIGLVSESRFFKTIAELYPDENIPDLVTILAWDVKIIEDEETPTS